MTSSRFLISSSVSASFFHPGSPFPLLSPACLPACLAAGPGDVAVPTVLTDRPHRPSSEAKQKFSHFSYGCYCCCYCDALPCPCGRDLRACTRVAMQKALVDSREPTNRRRGRQGTGGSSDPVAE